MKSRSGYHLQRPLPEVSQVQQELPDRGQVPTAGQQALAKIARNLGVELELLLPDASFRKETGAENLDKVERAMRWAEEPNNG